MMRISIGQIIVLSLLIFLLFGDFQSTKKKLTIFIKQIKNFLQRPPRKKGF